MGERARVRLIRAAQSDELRETFRQLAEIDGPNGPKFPRRVLMELAARIVGRAYEPMLLELCHLVRAAKLASEEAPGGRRAAGGGGAGGAGFEWLFWGVEEARAGAFRAAFLGADGTFAEDARPPAMHGDDQSRRGKAGALDVGDESVTLAYADGRFEVRYGRMADLAAMMELIVSTLGYRGLVAALEPLAAPGADRGTVAGAARDLARRLYEWLGDHLPAAQAQRKFHAMIAYLGESAGPDFTEEDIDDGAVLHFWLRHVAPAEGETAAGGASADFRGYRNTFLAFLALARVLETGAAIGRFERRTPIGSDVEAGRSTPRPIPLRRRAAPRRPIPSHASRRSRPPPSRPSTGASSPSSGSRSRRTTECGAFRAPTSGPSASARCRTASRRRSAAMRERPSSRRWSRRPRTRATAPRSRRFSRRMRTCGGWRRRASTCCTGWAGSAARTMDHVGQSGTATKGTRTARAPPRRCSTSGFSGRPARHSRG